GRSAGVGEHVPQFPSFMDRTGCLRCAMTTYPARKEELFKELAQTFLDRKSTRLNSSHGSISYAVFCLKKKKKKLTDLVNVMDVLINKQYMRENTTIKRIPKVLTKNRKTRQHTDIASTILATINVKESS